MVMYLKRVLSRPVLSRLILVAVVAIFVILPFTTPITVFLGTNISHFGLFKVWKEIMMVIVLALVILSGIWRNMAGIKERRFKLLLVLMAGYTLWAVGWGFMNLTVFHQINWEAFVYALITDLRFLLFLVLCWLIAQDHAILKKKWPTLLLAPAAVVVAFGVLQYFVLPADFLRHLGYSAQTITPYQLVDERPDYVRIQSTLRGPNTFGVYLILVIVAAAVCLGKRRIKQLVMLAASAISLFATYSRSAWLGVVASLGLLSFINIHNPKTRQIIFASSLCVILLVGTSAYLARNGSFVQNTLLHTSSTSKSPESSNAGRSRAIKESTKEVLHEPFGRGPGSAGPASLRNNKPERIAENYYLQLGQELGWLGLGLFLAINVLVAMMLWERRTDRLAKILLASFVGIAISNMFAHAWMDDTISLLWWGLAGIALAPNLLQKSRQEPVRKSK